MADIYTDFATGNDTTGTGTTLLPYKTIQKSINVCNGMDTIWIANTSAQVLTSVIVWNTGSGTTTPITVSAPLTIRSWNNGGSITISNPAGNIVAAEINGNAAVTTIFTTASQPSYVFLNGIKMHNTTSTLVSPSTGWSFYNCEFYGGAGTFLCNGGSPNAYIGCYFHDDTGSGVIGLLLATSSLAYGCFFKNMTGFCLRLGGNGAVAVSNIIECGTGPGGVSMAATETILFNNTIVGTSTASQNGIQLAATTGRGAYIFNNIITDFSGTGGVGINFVSVSYSSFFGNNSFRNNTTNISGKLVYGTDLTANDITETSTPYTNAASANFALVTGALSIAASLPQGIVGSGTLQYIDNGGAQKQITGGGGSATVGSGYAA